MLLGPVLRHVGETTATVWVQTDRPAVVEVLGARASTFTVAGCHYALVDVTGLVPATSTEYEVHLDSERVWPREGSAWPAGRIRTRGGNGPLRVVFGSCRHPKPDEPRQAALLGIDALDVYATRLASIPSQQWPDALLLLGDQVYADNPTPQTWRWMAARRDIRQPPGAEAADFTEYVRLYVESWSDEELRWLLSTVPTAMIFDDHDVRDDWNTSAAWRDHLTAQRWWRERIRGGLASYWVYQHAGNLGPEERAADPTYRAVVDADGDAWPVLARMADAADTDPTSIRWSFRWDLDRARLVMVDTRCGRVLTEGARAMLDDAEFSWVEDSIATAATDAVDHLLVGSSLPWLLPPAVSDLQSANEVGCARGSALAERIRQAADLEHWPAFRASFDRFTAALRRVAAEPGAPATVSVLSGDVHHSYTARARFDEPVPTPVHQLVSSPVHHAVPGHIRLALRVSWLRLLGAVARRLARRSGVPDPAVSWRRTSGPHFGNALAVLRMDGRRAKLTFERADAHRRRWLLGPVSEVALTGARERVAPIRR
ncbi:MAG: alkaline phosphatase family protein [Pseudonocardiaceae bacterium]|nr:alkaline phosphatase family protein [Pseudonocardiaceae bacterium]